MFFFKKKDKSEGSVDWLVAGLGNPGSKYECTRHNVGFIALDMLASRLGGKIDRLKFQSLYCRARLGDASVLLLKPQTFMNLSGTALWEAGEYFKIPPERMIVIYDDISLPPGKLRVRAKGSDGGHKGVKSIIYRLDSESFPRVKVGVGMPENPEFEVQNWVLSTFDAGDVKLVAEALEHAVLAAETIVSSGVEAAANKYN